MVMSTSRDAKEARKQREKAMASIAESFASLSATDIDGLASGVASDINLPGIQISRLGGNLIPVFRVTSENHDNASLILRAPPNESGLNFVKIGSTLRADKNASAYISKEYLLKLSDRENNYLELSEDCSRGDLEAVAARGKQAAASSKDWEPVAQSALQYTKNILEMMVELERREICFPDIKPGNFMLADDGRVMLSDYKTLISTAGKEKIHLSLINDTEAYRSPEHFKAFDTANHFKPADLYLENRYKLGLALYEIATGDKLALDLQYRKIDEGVKHEHVIDTNHPVFKTEAGKQILPVIAELMNSHLYQRIGTPNRSLQSFADDIQLPAAKKQATASSSASMLSAFKQQKPTQDLKPIAEAHAASDRVKKPKNPLVRAFSQVFAKDKISTQNDEPTASGPTKKR